MTPTPTTPPPNDVNASQRLAADPNLSVWVQANAGSGKTKVLIDRLARLLLSGADPDKILALTFTKAAAAEMKARLYEKFRDWCAFSDSKLRKELAELEGLEPHSINDAMVAKARTLLIEILETRGGLRIETIHAFAQKLLSQFQLEADFPSNPILIEGAEEARLWDTARRATILSLSAEKPETLDKLFTVSDVGYIVEQIRNSRAGIQDVFDASNGDLEQVGLALGEALQTPQETRAQILQHGLFGPAMPLAAIRRIMAEIEADGHTDSGNTGKFYNLLSQTMSTEDPETRWAHYGKLASSGQNPFLKEKEGHPDFELYRIQNKAGVFGAEIRRLKLIADALKRQELAEKTFLIYQFAHSLFQHYSNEKKAIGGLDNADLIDKTLELFTRISSADWVLYKLDSKLEHILLDEAQDTSPRQWAFLECLLNELHANPSASGRVRTQFTVGDEKQSIYRFQGADPASFLDAEAAFHAAGREDRCPVSFGTSFRTVPQILEFVDAVLEIRAKSNATIDATLPDPPIRANLTKHVAYRDMAKGCVELWPSLPCDPKDDDKSDVTAWNVSGKVDYSATIERRLAQRVADHIAYLLKNRAAIEEKGVLRPCEPRDFLILVQKRKPLMSPIVHALKQANIPVAGMDRISLHDDIGVQDCLNLMRFVLQPEDDLTLAEILRGPFIGMTDDDQCLFPLAYKREASLWAALQATSDDKFTPASQFLSDCLQNKHLSPFDFLNWALFARDGLQKILQRLGPPARDPLDSLLDRALDYEVENVPDLQAFLLELDADTSDTKRVAAKDVNYVRVMSVHGAKGLEAPIVILPQPPAHRDPRSGSFKPFKGYPLWVKADDAKICPFAQIAIDLEKHADLEETFRLFYVAMTRARDFLYIFEGQRKDTKKELDKVSENSWAYLARAAMDKLGVVVEDSGLKRFGHPPVFMEQNAAPKRDMTKTILPDWLLRVRENVTPETIKSAPTPSEKGEEVKCIKPFESRQNSAAAQGTFIHALFEHLIPISPDKRGEIGKKLVQNQTDIPTQDAENALERVLQTLAKPDLAQLFDARTGQNEVPIFGRLAAGGDPINGRIDRLVNLPDKCIILDYKSDAHPPSSLGDVPPQYVRQLALYRALMAQAKPKKPIEAAILWTNSGQLMKLADESLKKAVQ